MLVTDEITLTLPREPEFHRVAHLVLGGLAVRLNLTIENLEDLELALDAILVAHRSERRRDHRADDAARRRARDDRRAADRQGPRRDRARRRGRRRLGLRRVLESTVDDIHVDGAWVRLTKKVASRG